MQNENPAKKQIIEVALKLFKASEFEKASISRICKEAGVTRQAFYYYFNTKEEILEAYLNETISSSEEIFNKLLALGNDWDRYIELFNYHLIFFEKEGPEFTRSYLRATLTGAATAFKSYYLTTEWALPLLKNCQDQGIIRADMSLEVLSDIITDWGIGYIMAWSLGYKEMNLDEFRKVLESIVLKQ